MMEAQMQIFHMSYLDCLKHADEVARIYLTKIDPYLALWSYLTYFSCPWPTLDARVPGQANSNYILLSIWAWVLKIDHSTFFVYLWIAYWNGWTYLRPTMIHPGCQGLNGVRLKGAPENNPEDPEPPIWPTVLKGRGMISRLNSTPGP